MTWEYTKPLQKFMVRVKEKDVPVGNIVGNTYYTDREPKHFFGIYQGFGISAEALRDCLKKGVEHIIITYKGKKQYTRYKSTVRKFLTKGEVYYNTRKKPDGTVIKDKQYVLNLEQLEVEG